jgi:hypothetical protein
MGVVPSSSGRSSSPEQAERRKAIEMNMKLEANLEKNEGLNIGNPSFLLKSAFQYKHGAGFCREQYKIQPPLPGDASVLQVTIRRA